MTRKERLTADVEKWMQQALPAALRQLHFELIGVSKDNQDEWRPVFERCAIRLFDELADTMWKSGCYRTEKSYMRGLKGLSKIIVEMNAGFARAWMARPQREFTKQ